jgi:serine protease
VYTAAGAGLSAVCRFFSTAFGPKSSHFYTASAAECAIVKTKPDWLFEAEVFFVPTPAADGTCAAGTVPVYRMYNDGQGGAPNHRFTTEPSVRDAMLAKKWTPEGQGIGVTMCAPA